VETGLKGLAKTRLIWKTEQKLILNGVQS